MSSPDVFVVVPNWNGAESIASCLDSLQQQTTTAIVIVVDNGSVDGSVQLIKEKYPGVVLLEQPKNLGFAGGVNVGIKYAIAHNAKFVALFNNDAIADKNWLLNLQQKLNSNPKLGIVASKIVDSEQKHLDSTGEFYTTWGLPYPRGRDEAVSDKYDDQTVIFGASGGASLYRVEMLKQIGLFDEAFFAYYEDVDISFRAQLAGWKIEYVSSAVAYHQIGATSSKIKGFTTYQAMKNLPMIIRKNVPLQLLPTTLPRFFLAYLGFYFSAVARGQFWPATKGWFMALLNLPRNFYQRRKIHKNRQVSVDYIRSMLVYDLPPGAHELRKLRTKWWHLTGRKTNV